MILQQRLFVSISFLLIISLVVGTFTIIETTRSLYEQQLIQQSRHAATILSRKTVPLLRVNSPATAKFSRDRVNKAVGEIDSDFVASYQALVHQIISPDDIQDLILVDSSGTELFRHRDLLSRQSGDRNYNFPSWLPRLLVLANTPVIVDVTDDWQRLGTLKIWPSTESSYQDLWQHIQIKWLNLGWMSLLSLLILYFSLYFLLRPLGRFQQQLNLMADSDWQTQTSRYLTADMAEIQTAINITAERLQDLWLHQLKLIDQLHYNNYHDDLSGLLNRRGFDHRLEHLQQHHEGHHGLLMIVQISNLTYLNLEQGRRAGDDVIAGLGKLIQQWQQEHPGSFCGRHSGTDITLYAPCSDANQAHDVIQQTSTQLSLASIFQQRNLTFHIGGIFYGDSNDQVTQLLSKADAALKTAQEQSSPRHYLKLDEQIIEKGLTSQQWQDLLHQAIKEPSLRLQYQPILAANINQETDGQVLYYQALPRLTAPQGELPSASFWPLVEHHRLTVEFDLCVINLVLQNLQNLEALNQQIDQMNPVCVNISPASLIDERFYQQLTILLRRFPRVQSLLVFVIPEFCISQYQSSLIRLADMAQIFGIKIAVDQVTHIQALQLSQTLDLAFLKIDSRYGRHIHQLPEQRIMVQSIMQAARYRQLAVFIDGVNDGLDRDSLTQLGLSGLSGNSIAACRESPYVSAG